MWQVSDLTEAELALCCQRMVGCWAAAEQGPKDGEGSLKLSVKGGYLSKNWLHLMGWAFCRWV